MEQRVPSKASSTSRVISTSSIRLRSGAFSPRPLSQDDDTPTVVLVRRTESQLQPLPCVSPHNEDYDNDKPASFATSHRFSTTLLSPPGLCTSPPKHTHDDEENARQALSPIALTPRPDTDAEMGRLPTPNYPPAHANAYPRDAPHNRGGLARQLTSYFTRFTRPRAERAESAASAYSHASSASDESTAAYLTRMDSSSSSSSTLTRRLGSYVGSTWSSAQTETRSWVVPGAIKDKRMLRAGSTLSTTDKFTRKFPRPRGLASAGGTGTRKGTGGGDGTAAAMAMVEEGAGLGIERVGRWTAHKWCLLFSVCAVFVYGGAGLACAVLTWFGGKPLHS